ncbi:eCIS core domain-containing protein [Pseudonocardia sp. DLS-67]
MRKATTPSKKPHSASVPRSTGFFGAARRPGFFTPVLRKAADVRVVQAKPTVSKPGDPLEKQADRAADQVMRMPDAALGAPPVQRTAEPQVQRFGEGPPAAAAGLQSQIQQATTGGQALPSEVRSFMEPRLGTDFGDVRVHADETSHSLSNHLSARAFTYRNHVFFGRNQFRPGTAEGRHLLAHELTHTIQQGTTVAHTAAPETLRVPKIPKEEQGPPTVQRLGVRDVLDYFADKAAVVPGYRMLTLVIGFNPINGRGVDRTAGNFLRALIELVPGGVLITQALDNHGVISSAASWVERKVAGLGDIGAGIVAGLKRFVDSLGWTDILDPGDVWDRAKRIVTDPITRLIAFGTGVVGELLHLVKQAILPPLAALATGTRGYDLLKAILGRDPITGEPYPRTAETLIGGFMKLIGQEEVWENLKRGKAVQRAYAWFQGALTGLLGFVRTVPARILETLRSLTFQDVISVVGAFRRVGSAFLGIAVEFGSWAGRQVLSLLEILVSVVAPGVMPYIARARTAFHTIIKDPVRFVGHLVRAGRLGFQRFADNILEHLKTALIKWLVGPLAEAGVYIPKSFSLLEIVKLVLSVLGLTWQNIRGNLVKIIPEPVLQGLEKTASILLTLVKDGPAAAWEQIKAELSELKDQLIGQVTQMIQIEVVKAAVQKLVMMLNPAGAAVQAILAIWNTVSFFVEKIQQIGAVVASFVDSISAIAAGQVDNAAKRVELTMANTLTLVIGFLAKFAGLGSIPAKLVGIVRKIRAPIDRALDKIVAWLGKLLDKLVAKAKDAARKILEWWRKKVPITGGDEPHTLTFQGERRSAKLVVQSDPEKPSEFLQREADAADAGPKADKPLAATRTSETQIASLQGELVTIDDNSAAAAGGTQRAAAEDKSHTLDKLLVALSKIIIDALTEWGGDGKVATVVIERSGFTVSQKRKIAAEYEEQKKRLAGKPFAATDYLVDDEKGRRINVAENIDRRHVVSSDDMATHYEKHLSDKKLSEAKLLIEQRGSIPEARVPVVSTSKKKKNKLDSEAIVTAAKIRFGRFFGYAKNIFLGDSSENRSIQKHLDDGHPEMADAELDNHVSRMKRAWAFDESMPITPVKKT